MVTTIQLNEPVKIALDQMKDLKKQTYEQVILHLLELVEHQKREQEALMIEGYKEIAEESLKISKEFERIEDFGDWEW
ncbi:hypothetical protein HN510_05140 [Candidatus Woesearchaeota archaeon]|jgi:hypothetical protein|nr:hypothetical protein [Candidatus Woesearchaeota archaeon]